MNDLVPIATVSREELQQHVYYVDGSWRDIYVLNASRVDWKIWADFVNANYRLEFTEVTDSDNIRHNHIDFAAMEHLWNGHGQANMLTATFFVGEIPIRCYFFQDDEIENDIDPRMITSYAVHQQLMDYMTRLSQALGKEVVLTPENDTPQRSAEQEQWQPLLSVNGEQILVQVYWLGPRLH